MVYSVYADGRVGCYRRVSAAQGKYNGNAVLRSFYDSIGAAARHTSGVGQARHMDHNSDLLREIRRSKGSSFFFTVFFFFFY